MLNNHTDWFSKIQTELKKKNYDNRFPQKKKKAKYIEEVGG